MKFTLLAAAVAANRYDNMTEDDLLVNLESTLSSALSSTSGSHETQHRHWQLCPGSSSIWSVPSRFSDTFHQGPSLHARSTARAPAVVEATLAVALGAGRCGDPP